jgi:phosphate-selective porin OprO and OprP
MRALSVWKLTFVTAVLTSACALSVVAASAQGFYYKEITRDGRIYVFNIAAEAERFEQTGEMGRGITRPGAGPNGETVVGDSERALQLYFFKHGISEVVPEPPQPVQLIEWRDGKTRITTNFAYLELSNRIQVRYTHEFPDDTGPALPGTAAPGDAKGSFRIRRAKFKAEGWFWRPPEVAPSPAIFPRLAYELQLNWPDVTAANAPGNMLEDAMIAWDPKGTGKFRMIAGQFKVPFGRQQMTSSGNQQFVDRSLVSDEYARGRDTGFAVQGAVWSNKLEYRAGFFNGAGRTRSVNDNASFQVNARLMWQPNGNQVLAQRAWISGPFYSESDFESTTVPLYAVAVEFEQNDFHGTTTGVDLKSKVVGFDGIFKYKGFSSVGEYFVRRRTPESGRNFDSNGGYIQVGMMLNSFRTWEAAFRYGQRDPSDLVAADTQKEIRGALSYYYRRHSLKFQMDFGRIESARALGLKDNEVRLQTQFIF